ncbi:MULTISPECIES: hypothetical protein [Hymenobacter]|uniref:hypothetical protein n=1 Tax=Hymenobacter TaxID=89966 RepID=UPI0010585EF2|nr:MULTISPECIES: hypothetical protein [Hymenobacter]QIL76432.1 hypothetical protein G7064_11590 [Hymenobacter sp. HDW8]
MKNSIIVWAAAGSVAALGLSGCATSESGTKADKRFARGEYETAIALYKAQAERGKNAPRAIFGLANRIDYPTASSRQSYIIKWPSERA